MMLLVTCTGSLADVPERGEVLVSAAASLSDGFGALEAAFEAEHPGVDVILNLGASSTLREQIAEGAPVDVFAPASVDIMQAVVDAGMVLGEPQVFALNRLQIAVPAGNPAGVSGLDDFDRPELWLGLCNAAVPCGSLARQVLARAGVDPAIDTEEPDVRALLSKVASGELDAGIVYASDVVAAGETVEGIEIPAEANVTAKYPIALLVKAPNLPGATAWVEFVLSPPGREVLIENGFTVP